jgi:hypothetical protein
MPRVPVYDENGHVIGDTDVDCTADGILTGITLRRTRPSLSGELLTTPLGLGEIRHRVFCPSLPDDDET